MEDFSRIITPFDAISRHLTPYLWQQLKVVTTSQAQFSHPPGCDAVFFAVNFFVNENDFDEFLGLLRFIQRCTLDRNGKLTKS